MVVAESGGVGTTAYSIRPQLLERRARLQDAAGSVSPGYLNDLIAKVDAALKKIDAGKYGLCETCNDSIEQDMPERNPPCRFCLDHLNDAERAHHQKDLDLATQIQFQLLPWLTLCSTTSVDSEALIQRLTMRLCWWFAAAGFPWTGRINDTDRTQAF